MVFTVETGSLFPSKFLHVVPLWLMWMPFAFRTVQATHLFFFAGKSSCPCLALHEMLLKGSFAFEIVASVFRTIGILDEREYWQVPSSIHGITVRGGCPSQKSCHQAIDPLN